MRVTPTLDRRLADALCIGFVAVIVVYAASGPLAELVRAVAERSIDGFAELSRREQRLALREHWLSAGHRAFERAFVLPTGLILGLPVLFGFTISALTLGRGRGEGAGGAPWARRLLALGSLIVFSGWVVKQFATDGGALPVAEPIDHLAFAVAVGITLYLTFRLFGGFIVAFCAFWIVYFFVRGWLPEWTGVFAGTDATAGQHLRAMVQNFWAQTGGMFGQPLQVVSGNILVFIVFGAVLTASGAGELLLKLANRLTGRLVGGAAHAAVASSALFGTLSGAAISNVVSTGVMTIPVIKRAGFPPAFAGGVEAAASTGGQIMPPVMGVVAFFVAGQIGLEYRYIVVAAIVPALLFYLGAFTSVYLEARRLGIGPLPEAARPALDRRDRVRCLVFVIPLGTLTFFLFTQPSVPKAGFWGLVAALGSSLALFPDFRSWARVRGALVEAGRMSAQIVVIVAAIGLIVGLIQVSGFSGRLALLLTQLASGPLPVVLAVVALGSIVLGMGLPPGATYFIIVVALSAGIDSVGVPPLTLHLFVVFFAVMSTVTPPVALAAFAAAPIAGADPIRTGLAAARIGLAGFLIPFVFVYHPAVLYKLQTVFEWFGEPPVTSAAMADVAAIGWGALAWIVAAFALAMWLLASALAGFERAALGTPSRLARAGLGVAVLLPEPAVAAPAAVAALLLLFLHRRAVPRVALDPSLPLRSPS